jgi:hypothetical protein
MLHPSEIPSIYVSNLTDTDVLMVWEKCRVNKISMCALFRLTGSFHKFRENSEKTFISKARQPRCIDDHCYSIVTPIKSE